MKKLFLFLTISSAFVLPACAAFTTGSFSPAQYASQTKADEQGAITAELAYKSWRLAATTAVTAGILKNSDLNRVAILDNKLYAGLLVVRAAYKTGNSADIASAVGNFNVALAGAHALVGGK